ncbi:hypothetical protein G7K_5536-t1 [Saitoella complicata NRRL Y-17804]|uniref:Uncharacterized protein n=1 Tax=Saitoella complicata (strain BCRC 22490 / CBS 7301 / JCM 7358 / NBRC 10748 / NRRL Y-17804) TaxID=698492 RepID=A0A0E9NPU2_SAICN|nr:hypothetical protein G7K_5536-t1 [Saitoella complicata NRRL Y-17804]
MDLNNRNPVYLSSSEDRRIFRNESFDHSLLLPSVRRGCMSRLTQRGARAAAEPASQPGHGAQTDPGQFKAAIARMPHLATEAAVSPSLINGFARAAVTSWREGSGVHVYTDMCPPMPGCWTALPICRIPAARHGGNGGSLRNQLRHAIGFIKRFEAINIADLHLLPGGVSWQSLIQLANLNDTPSSHRINVLRSSRHTTRTTRYCYSNRFGSPTISRIKHDRGSERASTTPIPTISFPDLRLTTDPPLFNLLRHNDHRLSADQGLHHERSTLP